MKSEMGKVPQLPNWEGKEFIVYAISIAMIDCHNPDFFEPDTGIRCSLF